MKRTRQAWVAAACVVLGVVAVPLATAWACTSLATLSITPTAGNTGQPVTGTGARFGSSAQGNSAVEVHWNTADGPILATVVPNDAGSINFSFKAPEGAPGYYTVIAIQKDAKGQPVRGTPARATFALNDPAPQDVVGAGGATTVDQQAAIQAPDAVAFAATPPVAETTQQAPVAAEAPKAPAVQHQAAPAAPAAASTPAETPRPVAVAPSQPLPPIPPSGARAADVVAPASSGSFLAGPGLALVMVGAVSLVAAALLALVVPRRRPAVRRAHR